METTQVQNASSTGTTPTSNTSPTSKTNTESTNAGSTTDSKGKQPQVLTSKKRNVEDRKKSQIWDHFTKLDVDPKAPRAECNYCGKSYACHIIVNGTSNMWSHLKVCKKFPFVVDKKQKVLVLEPKIEKGELREQNVGSLMAIGYNYDECRQALAKMVIIDELPFNFVEGRGFKLFARTMQPRFDIPSRFTIMRDCLKLYVEEKDRLRIALRVSNHMGETIGQVIENCLLEWGIDKLLTITLDNASSNNVTISYLKNVMKDWPTTILSNEHLHVRCCAHIVNLIVCDGLKEINVSVVKIRNAIRFVRSSPSRHLAFKKWAEKLHIECKKSLCLDVATRWNSTYLMLEAAEKFEKVFVRLGEKEPRYMSYFLEVDSKGNKKNIGSPSLEDWENARTLIKFLKIFYMVTLRFSGSLHVTSNSFFDELIYMHSNLLQLCKSKDSILSGMAMNMMLKFEKYWGCEANQNFLLYVANVLDPRLKLKYVKFCFGGLYDYDKAQLLTNKVKDTLVSLYEFYLKIDEVVDNNRHKQDVNAIDDVEVDVNTLARFKRHLQEEDSVENKNEVERYLIEGCEDPNDDKLDILGWWKNNALKYKTLSKVAQHVLAIPISTVASESAFSTGGRVLDQF
ncbi:zinc finger BED domain-containing protein RICESLEEPER 2-like [Populus alba]|uniref:zinc finger BED domain-containing protein RICESLEEPER 2-like n=1 Tax=Populus alba TaxID=43335 RepID=UPI00158A3A42|nr:zinc finger BED domain-containing protein RICESLEEPER 2-like [Populus alba]